MKTFKTWGSSLAGLLRIGQARESPSIDRRVFFTIIMKEILMSPDPQILASYIHCDERWRAKISGKCSSYRKKIKNIGKKSRISQTSDADYRESGNMCSTLHPFPLDRQLILTQIETSPGAAFPQLRRYTTGRRTIEVSPPDRTTRVHPSQLYGI